MPSMPTSPYKNQEKTSPIVIRPPSVQENALTAFRFGRRTEKDTLDVLVEIGAFGPELLTGTLLAMSYGAEMLSLREAIHAAPDVFRDFFCQSIELAVNAGDISSDDGRLFLNLFGGDVVE